MKYFIVETEIDYTCSCSQGWPQCVYGPFESNAEARVYLKKTLRGREYSGYYIVPQR